MTTSIKFYDKDYDCNFKYAVIAAFYKGKYVFVRHKDRTTLEIPGGKCEQGETIEQTARRELYEETGAEEFTLTPVCIYKLNNITVWCIMLKLQRWAKSPNLRSQRCI